jgi:hypothetical protein
VINGEGARKRGRDRLICFLMLCKFGVLATDVLWCGKFGTLKLGMIVVVRFILWCSGS